MLVFIDPKQYIIVINDVSVECGLTADCHVDLCQSMPMPISEALIKQN